jgi:nucleoside-diphosphate-sugar epimerase
MRVFVTGATGFVGSAIVGELLAAGHTVLGLARSDRAAETLSALGAEPHRGELTDLDSLAAGAKASDGVIHTAFIHDFSRFEENAGIDYRATEAMADALAGSGKPFVSTSGTGLLANGRKVTEADGAGPDSAAGPRAAAEILVRAAAGHGVRSSVVRLPQVHGPGDHGFVAALVGIAHANRVSAFIGDGANRWPSVHRLDAARLYRLALEKAQPGSRFHAVAEEGVTLRAVAEVIGEGLGVPVRSIPAQEAEAHFGWLARFAGMDNPASSEITQATLGWRPEGPDLLTDMRQTDYFG